MDRVVRDRLKEEIDAITRLRLEVSDLRTEVSDLADRLIRVEQKVGTAGWNVDGRPYRRHRPRPGGNGARPQA